MKQRYHDDNDLLQDYASAHLPRVHDGMGDSCFHRPGFRVTDAPPSEELQRPRDAYEHDLRTAYRRGAGKEDVMPDAPKASGNDEMPVDDIETAISSTPKKFHRHGRRRDER
jgi:hypothetical protein